MVLPLSFRSTLTTTTEATETETVYVHTNLKTLPQSSHNGTSSRSASLNPTASRSFHPKVVQTPLSSYASSPSDSNMASYTQDYGACSTCPISYARLWVSEIAHANIIQPASTTAPAQAATTSSSTKTVPSTTSARITSSSISPQSTNTPDAAPFATGPLTTVNGITGCGVSSHTHFCLRRPVDSSPGDPMRSLISISDAMQHLPVLGITRRRRYFSVHHYELSWAGLYLDLGDYHYWHLTLQDDLRNRTNSNSQQHKHKFTGSHGVQL